MRGLLYDDPIHDVAHITESLTPHAVRELGDAGVAGIKVGPAVDAGSLRWLAELPTLRRLDLSGHPTLTDADLAFLERVPGLTALSLAYCKGVGDGAAASLHRLASLEQINLEWTWTGDGVLAALAGQPALARVTVGGLVTDAGVVRLRDYPALMSAAAGDTLLSLSSARTLTDAALAVVGDLRGLAALDVHKSAFGSPHYTARGVRHLTRLPALEWLNFHGGLAGDDTLHEIAAIPRLRWLHCQDIVSGTEGFLALARCRMLEWFAARVCPRLTDRGFAAVARLPRLQSLSLGGPRVTDAAMAALEGAAALTALTPIGCGDAAFEHIARIPNLTHLTNMYNRSSGDGATRHLAGHRALVDYSAFGTQITDESLHILAGIPTIERVSLENCWWITDDGLRRLASLPRLRAVAAWSCTNVRGDWTTSMPAGVDVRSEAGPPGHATAYRAETLLDHPELSADDGLLASTAAPTSGLALVCDGGTAGIAGDTLHVVVAAGAREAALLTRDAYRLPARLEIEVRPMTALRLLFTPHNRMIALDELGFPVNPTPWFLSTPAQAGRSHRTGSERQIRPDEWTRVTLELGSESRELLINGELRHSWSGDAGGLRTRFGIGVRGTEIFVRSLRVIETGGV